MRVPAERIVAFAGPCVSVIAGGIATWSVAKANVLGFEGMDETNVATHVAGALTFTLVTVLSWRGQSKWLSGGHVVIHNQVQQATAALTAACRPLRPTRMHAPPPSPPAAARSPARPSAHTSPPPRTLFQAAPMPHLQAEADTEADDAARARDVATTVADVERSDDAETPPAEPTEVPEAAPGGTPDALRPLMPSESPLQGEPDEVDDP